MPSELPAINRIAVAAHPKIAAASKVARQIEAYLLDRGKAVSVGFIGGHELNEKAAAGKFDIWICLGGDGSMLRSGHVCGPNRLPVLGINLGTVGFLTSVQQDKWSVGLDQLLEGQFSLERRMMLKAWRIHAGKPSSTWHVLNEVTVGRGYAMRPVRLSTHVDDSVSDHVHCGTA